PRRRGRCGGRSRRGWLRGASGSPCGRALVEECAQAFLAFRAGAQPRCKLRRFVSAWTVANQLLRCARGFGPGAEQLADDALDRLVQFVRELVDEAGPEGGLGVETLAGQEEPPRCRGPDAREDERRDHGRNDPELDLREAEDGIGRRDRDVGAADQPRAPAEGVTL